MSRPARRNGEYGLRPATGSVVDFWKNSGTISTAPPTLTTSVTSAISNQGFFSIHSCENFILCSESGVTGGQRGNARHSGLAVTQGHPGVVGHHTHAAQVQQAAGEAHHVVGEGGFNAF